MHRFIAVPLRISILLLGCPAAFAGVVRIADGDCTALTTAAAAPAGSEPSLIMLAAKGHYALCALNVTGTIAIDGAGASLQLLPRVASSSSSQVSVAAGASLTLRNLNVVGQVNGAAPAALRAEVPSKQSPALFIQYASIANSGTLILDAVSISGIDYSGAGTLAMPLVANAGTLHLRNATFANNTGHSLALIQTTGEVTISQATFSANDSGPVSLLSSSAAGSFTISNTLFAGNASPVCAARGAVASIGGNVTTDDSCGLVGAGDRVVGEAAVGAFGDNGGLVNTIVLNENSPAVHAGLAANCEAADARGTVRNVQARGGCDAGAFELGGGRGLLSQGGMSGLYFDAAADGHYVTVQRLDWGSALVVWNTFDRNGQAAWIYSIGTVSGNHVHADAAQNLGGRLQPGGAPTGSHGVSWGTIDIDLANCRGGTFSYASPLPNFGSGTFPLNRLAFLGDLDCSN